MGKAQIRRRIHNSEKNEEEVILYSKQSPYVIVNNLQIKSKKYKLSNRFLSGILCKIIDNRIIIYIPWSLEKREFKGSIYESKDGSKLQGKFLVPKRTCYIHLGFWLIVWTLLIFILLNVSVIVTDNYFLMIFIVAILLFLFDLWHLLIFRSKSYEGKIIEFLNKCLIE